MATHRGNQIRLKRIEERDRIFGDCAAEVWGIEDKGFAPVPRLLPLFMHLVTKDGAKDKGNPGKVYLDLWTRSFEAGFLKIDDESAAAYSAGYDNARGMRTWREHMRFLEQQGFIRVAPNGNKSYGYVLLIDPFLVVARKLKEGKLKDKAWINAFVARIGEVGAVLPDQLVTALKTRVR